MEGCCYTLITSSPAILNFQGASFSASGTSFRTASGPQSPSSSLAKPFLQINNNFRSSINQQCSSSLNFKSYKGIISAKAEKKAWDFGRFVKTVHFFYGPPSPAKVFDFLVEKLAGPSPNEPVKVVDSSGTVLVAGATGGIGRRVVDVLRKKGLSVRVLVRNEDKAKRMLGPDVDMIVGDVTNASTLLPEYFKGVRKVINAVSFTKGPKKVDTPERAKDDQGIHFFESEIKGDSPKMVEYIGMKNLINALEESVAQRSGKLVFGFDGDSSRDLPWGPLDDIVMGGVSESTFHIDPTGGENGNPTGLFTGIVSTSNNGGFASIRTKDFTIPEDLSAYDGFELRIKGDGRRYELVLRTTRDWEKNGYASSFDTVEGWQWVRVPFSSLRPTFRAETVQDAPPFDPSHIISLQLMFIKYENDGKLNPTFVEGPFQLPVSIIRSYIKEPITPRFVHVGSAPVTRVNSPELDLSKQPTEGLDKGLESDLTYILRGEDMIRESGIPYTIIRPCALTEEPAGADLLFEQGDSLMGNISREEVALICVAALESSNACDKTFELKSSIPLSEPLTVDPENPPPEKDYEKYFSTLKQGFTGKETVGKGVLSV